MGLFSSIKKTFKKIVKKVGNGIKKVAKGIGKVMGKIAKPFQKFGILGQIALGFIMPYAIGGIFKGFGYLASEGFGAFAGELAGSANLFKQAAGVLAKGIHTAASGLNTAYTYVSDGIKWGLDKVGEFGSRIKTGITDLYEGAAEWVTGKVKTIPAEDAALDELFAEDLFEYAGSTTVAAQQNVAQLQNEIVNTVNQNALQRTGSKLVTAGNKALSTAGTTLLTQGENLAKQQELQQQLMGMADNGPTVPYLLTPEEKITQDIDFSVKSMGGNYFNPYSNLIARNELGFGTETVFDYNNIYTRQ